MDEKLAQLHKDDAKLFRQLANNAEKRAELLERQADVSAQRGGGNGRPPGG